MSPIKPEHTYNLIEVSAVEIAADGSAVVFVQQEINKETMKRESRIVVQTPVLLMHGEEDYRCPIEQAEQFFVALKRQGKAVEFVRFPKSSHGFRRSGHPALHVEYLDRMLSWLERYCS